MEVKMGQIYSNSLMLPCSNCFEHGYKVMASILPWVTLMTRLGNKNFLTIKALCYQY